MLAQLSLLTLSFLSRPDYLRLFIARPFIIVVGAATCAYNFDMWNTSLMQMSFFSGIIILFYLWKLSGIRSEQRLIACSLVVIIVSQIIYLTNGERFARMHEIKEFKEFFIALALFLYSLDVSFNLKRVYTPDIDSSAR